jgi:hypothetical protein
LLFRGDIVTTFSGETVTKLRVLSLLALGILVCALGFAGCSGSNTIAITLSAPQTSLNPGQTVTIIASLTNDVNNAGVTWTLTGAGSLSGNTTTSVVYTAPTDVAVSTTATVTATSIANTTITATESVTLNAVLTITTTSLPSAILGVPYDAFINAAGAPAPFTWIVKSGTIPPGLTFLATSTSTSAEISGTATTLGTYNFTVQVTDSSDATVTQALSITVNVPPPLSVVTGSLPVGTVNMPYPQTTLQANSGVPPYSWNLIDGTTLPLGFVTPLPTNGTISGTPVVSGNFPITVQVKDSSTPNPQTATANLNITINQGTTNNSLLSGNYAFSVRGFDENGLFVAAGSFIADGMGNISSGVMDTNDTVNPSLNQSFSGTYSINLNGLGSLILNLSPTVSRIFELSMQAGGNANIVEFDDTRGFKGNSALNSGVLLRQDPTTFFTTSITGGYAFGFLGIDSSENRFGMAGDFQADGVGGNITSGLFDSDDANSVTAASVPFSGTYSVASNGRGLATFGTSSYSFYVVNATELLAVEIDPFVPGGTNPLVSGTILQQSDTPFGNGSLVGFGVFELTALAASTGESQVGLFQADGSVDFSLTSDQNSAGMPASPAGNGTYSVATNGRVALTPSLTGSGFQNTTPTSPQPVLYLVSLNEAFIIGTDPEVSFGFMALQSGAPFTPASLSGTYAGGSLAPVDPNVSNVVSTAVAGSDTLNVTAYASGPNGLSFNQGVDATAVAASGRVVATQNKVTVDILYMVSPTEFFQLSADPTARVDIFQQ